MTYHCPNCRSATAALPCENCGEDPRGLSEHDQYDTVEEKTGAK